MNHRHHFSLLLLACGLTTCFIFTVKTGHAQPQDAKLKQFTVHDGLPFSSVSSITQDGQGFMWIGTNRGLYRHDGYTFTPYLNDPEDPRSLAADDIQSVYTDKQGTLWVSTLKGLDRYDLRTDTFSHLRHAPDDPNSLSSDSVRVVLEDRSGALWVGTWGGGLNKLDRL